MMGVLVSREDGRGFAVNERGRKGRSAPPFWHRQPMNELLGVERELAPPFR